MRWITAIFCLCVIGFSAAVSSAQDADVELVIPAARQGYWIGAGAFAVANQNYRLDEPSTGNLLGGGGHLRMGEMMVDWLGVGLQLGGGAAVNNEFDAGFGGALLDVQLVPWRHLNIHLGVGAGGIAVTDLQEEDADLLGTGGGFYAVGLGYDFFPFHERGSGGWSISPFLQVQYLPGAVFESTIVLFALESFWWTGLEKNKLDLELDDAFSK